MFFNKETKFEICIYRERKKQNEKRTCIYLFKKKRRTYIVSKNKWYTLHSLQAVLIQIMNDIGHICFEPGIIRHRVIDVTSL